MQEQIHVLQQKMSDLAGRLVKIEEELIFNSDFRRGFDLRVEREALRVQIGHCSRELHRAEMSDN